MVWACSTYAAKTKTGHDSSSETRLSSRVRLRSTSAPRLRPAVGGSMRVFCNFFSSSADRDRKSTRLNSSHSQISYAVFCLKKKKNKPYQELQLADNRGR